MSYFGRYDDIKISFWDYLTFSIFFSLTRMRLLLRILMTFMIFEVFFSQIFVDRYDLTIFLEKTRDNKTL